MRPTRATTSDVAGASAGWLLALRDGARSASRSARLARIDELANTVAMLRDQNKRLDDEAERYYQMLAAG